jgi:transcriptional regulator with XRE-family HTH domain
VLLELGDKLSRARAATGRSLEVVAADAAISPSYLRKLERGQVNDPSPRVLRRVGEALGVGYLSLMRLANYLTELDRDAATPAGFVDDELSDDEQRAVAAFTKYLKARR